MDILLFWLIFVVLVGVWANNWGRNGFGWGLIAAVISPLIAAIALLIVGKSIEKKAEEAKLMKELSK